MFKRPSPSEERSADERARAAAERAARRAAREGRPVEPPPSETFAAGADAAANGAAAPPEPPAPEPELYETPLAPPEPEPESAPEPLPEASPAPAAEDPPEDRRTVEDDLWTDEYLLAGRVEEVPAAAAAPDPEPTSPDEPPPMPPPHTAEHTVEWQAPDSDPGPDPGPAAAAAAPERPAPLPPRTPSAPARGERWRPATRAAAAMTAGPRAGRQVRRVLAVAGLAAIALLIYLAVVVLQPFHGDGRGAVRVTIPAGVDAGRIGDILAERGVVDSGRWFTVNATVTGRRGNLRPGTYTLARDMAYGDVIGALAQGPKAKVIKTYDLTIPEGRSARETDARIEKTDMEGDYLAATRSAAALRRARKLGLPRNVRTTEGFLFPATYELPEGTTAAELVGRQLQGFADNTAGISYARARRGSLTRYEVLIIASMIEREVQLDRERPLVAAVIYNRLKDGMTLGIDATIRYATNNWTRPIRVSELEADSPYNTRLRRGLPPTPIGNPGLASIKAAAKPADVDYLYYVVKPGSKGAHAFSSTDAEFQADVQRYNRARESGGGRAP